jgi:Family of unknown function (DUF6494)
MDEEVFNLELRKFLKHFGITAQREIEKAVDAALRSGTLSQEGTLPVRATLTIPGVLPELLIDGQIALSVGTSPPAVWNPPTQKEVSAPPKVP